MTVVTFRGKDYKHVTDLARHVVTDLARHHHHCLRHCGSLCRDQILRGRKFLAGAFFVSSGILWYLWVTDTSLPIVLPYAGTISVETPNISGQRAIVHFILFVLCLYFGFFSKKKENAKK
jgi:hypothetical protein